MAGLSGELEMCFSYLLCNRHLWYSDSVMLSGIHVEFGMLFVSQKILMY